MAGLYNVYIVTGTHLAMKGVTGDCCEPLLYIFGVRCRRKISTFYHLQKSNSENLLFWFTKSCRVLGELGRGRVTSQTLKLSKWGEITASTMNQQRKVWFRSDFDTRQARDIQAMDPMKSVITRAKRFLEIKRKMNEAKRVKYNGQKSRRRSRLEAGKRLLKSITAWHIADQDQLPRACVDAISVQALHSRNPWPNFLRGILMIVYSPGADWKIVVVLWGKGVMHRETLKIDKLEGRLWNAANPSNSAETIPMVFIFLGIRPLERLFTRNIYRASVTFMWKYRTLKAEVLSEVLEMVGLSPEISWSNGQPVGVINWFQKNNVD